MKATVVNIAIAMAVFVAFLAVHPTGLIFAS